MEQRTCLACKKVLEKRHQHKFCSNQCQADFRYQEFLKEWTSGRLKISTKNISGHIKRFLIEKYGAKCSCCGWDEKHPFTKKVPIEVDHVDGNADNNAKENVRLLCPNCHALTPSFRNLNKGKGRSWRKKDIK